MIKDEILAMEAALHTELMLLFIPSISSSSSLQDKNSDFIRFIRQIGQKS